MTPTDANTSEPDGRSEIRVTVNGQFVVFAVKQVNGEEIKSTAIAQGVPIQLDFDLSEVLPDGKQRPIRNDKSVTLKEGDEFWAIPGDDNS